VEIISCDIFSTDQKNEMAVEPNGHLKRFVRNGIFTFTEKSTLGEIDHNFWSSSALERVVEVSVTFWVTADREEALHA
jgi:hypothetical protein